MAAKHRTRNLKGQPPMTNTPGWASPGSSDSPEPDDGDSPAPPTPSDSATSAGTSTAAAPSGPAADQGAPEEAIQEVPQGASQSAGHGHSGWSQRQPPPGAGWGQWAPPASPPPPPAGAPRWGAAAPGGWQQQGPWSKPAAPKPGVIPLRPLGIGEMLDGAITTLRRHWRSILGVTLAVALVTEGIGVVVQGLFIDDTRIKNLRDNPDPSVSDIMHALSGTFAGSSLTILVLLIGWCVATAMLTLVTSRAVIGRPVTTAQAWQDARPRLAQLIGLALLLPLIGCGVLAVAVLPGALIALAGAADGGAALASLGLLGGFVVVIWLLVQWSLAAPALMLEKQGIVAAMKRSAKLVRGAWWRVLGVQIVALLLAYIVTAIIETPFTLIASAVTGDDNFSSFLSGDNNPSWAFLVISGVGAVIGATITLPVTAGVTALLYMDQRIRRESLDLELIRAAKEN